MTVLLAETSIWPIIIFAIVAMLFGGGKKKRPSSTMAPPPDHGDEPAAGGLMGELNRALQELKRAEQEALQRRTGQVPPAVAETTREAAARKYLEQRKAATDLRGGAVPHGSAKGGELIKRTAHVPKPRPQPARTAAPARIGRFAPAADDADQAFEDPGVISLEGRDYDQEAERIIAERRRAFERGGRGESSNEELSAQQLARRADRAPAQAIGGKAEHDSWHDRMVAAEAAAVAAGTDRPARVSPLGRFATGRARDAIVLGEILGKPLGER